MDLIPASLAHATEEHLAQHGIHAKEDLSLLTWLQVRRITLEFDGLSIQVDALYLPRMSATDALHAVHSLRSDVPLLVIGPRVHETSANTLRAHGIWYLDEAGNTYIRDERLLIDVRGRRALNSTVAERLADRHFDAGAANPFTPKRAQVGLALLTLPELADAPFREIAARAGVSVGLAKSALDTLKTAGFVEQVGPRRRLIRGEELLNLWVSAYPGGLAKASTLLVAHGDLHNWSPPSGIDFAISGEQALGETLSHPETLIIYVHGYVDDDGRRRPPRELLLNNRWQRDSHGNVIIRELFWRDLPGMNETGGAPLVLTYADLLASHEPRQMEIAHGMRLDVERLVGC